MAPTMARRFPRPQPEFAVERARIPDVPGLGEDVEPHVPRASDMERADLEHSNIPAAASTHEHMAIGGELVPAALAAGDLGENVGSSRRGERDACER